VLVLVCALLTTRALAQDEPARDPHAAATQETGPAREHFVRGTRAIEVGRWADAVREFERAYELSRAPTALFNTGFALRALGRHVEARAAFDRLLADHADADEAVLDEARELREEVNGLIVTLALGGLRSDLRYSLRLDGQARDDTGARPVELEVDPGVHVLEVAHPSIESFRWETESWGGEELRATAELVPRAIEETISVLESPFFWIAIAAAVATGVVLTIVLADAADQPTTETNRVVEL
jgi:hypothetical protein